MEFFCSKETFQVSIIVRFFGIQEKKKEEEETISKLFNDFNDLGRLGKLGKS